MPLTLEQMIGVAVGIIVLVFVVAPFLQQVAQTSQCYQDYQQLKKDYDDLNTLYQGCLSDRVTLQGEKTKFETLYAECKQNETECWSLYNITLNDYEILRAKVEKWNFTVIQNCIMIFVINFVVLVVFKFAINVKIVVETEEGEEYDLIAIAIVSGILTVLISIALGIIPLA